ncbi:Molybdopterin-guanine dinucleotide biosynthesis protein MobA [hydrothermal vent metagenome]|uniref:Molybdopterin-guanine dinucleotide biosynthesis protein MobA n=1 Tax=hydrothermal vent metagenome TaxID=652676 RepID=A0A1W1CZD5_9ZZZZ
MKTRYNTPIIIIAGGKSSRMGKDKALLPFGSQASLAQFQYQRLSRIFSKVYLSAKYHKFDFDCEVIEDKYEESSPLVALLSIFETLNVQEIFVLSVDTPFVDEKVIHKLFERDEEDFDIIVAKNNNRLQPLCAIYRRSLLPLLQKHYQEKNHKLHHLLKNAKTKIVHFNDEKAFMNLNYFEDYEKALKVQI